MKPLHFRWKCADEIENQGRLKPSLKFFAGRGHHQIIATYYDRGSNWQNVVNDWLDAAEGVPNVDGIMYTTCSNNYEHLEEFMQLVMSR